MRTSLIVRRQRKRTDGRRTRSIGCSCFCPVLAPPYHDPTMILFPAIDLKDGHCVRLKRGEMAQATVFNDDPAAQARLFAAQGFSHMHIVDLNGAFAGKSVNAPGVEAILGAVSTPVQLGG